LKSADAPELTLIVARNRLHHRFLAVDPKRIPG
jgi:hypothetical protein